MSDFQFIFLCMFALALVTMAVIWARRENEQTIYTLTDDSAPQETATTSYTTYAASDILPEAVTAQTALDFAKVYARYAIGAVEQLYKNGEVAKEDRKEKAIEVLKVFLKADGYDPDDEDLSAALPYLIESGLYEESRPLF